MTIIRKFCGRCKKNITMDSLTFYLTIYQRENRENKDHCFLCSNCCTEFILFMEKENEKDN